MVRIRLRRTGAKNNPTYRIIVADQKAPRDGAFIDTIGHYLPTRQPHVLEINEAKAREWLGKGAQPSDTAKHLLQQKGILTAEGKIAPEGYVVPAKAPKAAPAPVAAAPVAAADTDLVAPAAEAPAEEAATEEASA